MSSQVLTFLASSRWASPDAVLPPDAGSAAPADKEAAATGGSCCSRCPAESRPAAARTGSGAAEGEMRSSSVGKKKKKTAGALTQASPLDGSSAGDRSASAAAAAAEGDLRSHPAAPTRHQDPVFHHRFHHSDPESRRCPANPGPVEADTRPLLQRSEVYYRGGFFYAFLCFQMAKIPQIVQQQPTVANIQQIVSSPQQVGPRCGCTSAPLCCSGGKFKTHFRLVRKCVSSS